MDNKSRIISEDLDKFKHKLSQNWFGNLNNSIENNIEQSIEFYNFSLLLNYEKYCEEILFF